MVVHEEKKHGKEATAPQLEDKDSDFDFWYERTKQKLDATSLWDDFCAKPETVPNAETQKDAYEKHVQRRKITR